MSDYLFLKEQYEAGYWAKHRGEPYRQGCSHAWHEGYSDAAMEIDLRKKEPEGDAPY